MGALTFQWQSRRLQNLDSLEERFDLFVSGVLQTQSNNEKIMKHLSDNNSLSLLSPMALALLMGFTGAWTPLAAVGAAPVVTRESHHKFVHIEYVDDGGICGTDPPSWNTYTTTDRLLVADWGTFYNVVFGEQGTYAVNYVDPAYPDVTSQFADAQHYILLPKGGIAEMEQAHDFPGGIRIRVHYTFVETNGEVHVQRDILDVTGCP